MIPRECPYCRASLDWGEKCDCRDEKPIARREKEFEEYMRKKREKELREFAKRKKEIDELPEYAKKFALMGLKV